MSVPSTRTMIVGLWLMLVLPLAGHTPAAASADSLWTDLAGAAVAAARAPGSARLARHLSSWPSRAARTGSSEQLPRQRRDPPAGMQPARRQERAPSDA
ncbi:MAG TPA: hypothetical protein VKF37_10370, partial [Chloroflexota bacterium]|nr:hypothetical protein [Chloroflexota bacterium]